MTEKPSSRPPLRTRILVLLLRASVKDSAAHDFDDHFQYLVRHRGRIQARIWYWFQLLGMIPSCVNNSLTWSTAMFLNNLKTALRVFGRHKSFTLINITGLAIGIASSILILLWVQDELGYDGFHEHGDDVYRIVGKGKAGTRGVSDYYAVTPLPLGPTLKREYPEVIMATRYNDASIRFQLGAETHLDYGALVDPDFLTMFSFGLLQGDPGTCLSDPFSIVVTENLAHKYFGLQNPVGKTMTTQAGTEFIVTGLADNPPPNSHLRFDFIIPFQIMSRMGADLENWEDVSYFTYVLLNRDAVVADVNQKINACLDLYRKERSDIRYLQPLKDIHLRSHFKFDMEGHGDIRYVYIFTLTAMFILMIACINFMNLATARSAGRAKEVGIRKVVGARRGHVIRQFFGESMLLALVSSAAAMVIVKLVLPSFNNLAQKPLSLNFRPDPALYLGLLGIIVFTGLLAGSYPALYLSSFRPIKVLRGRFLAGKKGSRFRKALVVLQFSLSILLIIGTLVVGHQIRYMKNANLGFDTQHVLYFPMSGDMHGNFNTLKNELLQNPDVLNVTAVDRLPFYEGSGTSNASWEGKPDELKVQMRLSAVDYEYLETFGLQMVEGRFFNLVNLTDASEGIVLNEAAVRSMGISDPIGKRFRWSQMDGRILGVIQDFQLRTLHYEVEPLFIFINPDWFQFICAKISSENIPETLAALEVIWDKFAPGYPFEFHFFDDAIDTLYRAEERIGTIIRCFTLLAVFISCLGLFGLASYMVEQRTKEIGIRKVLGASIPGIWILLSKEFLKWVVLANCAAWPIAYLVTHNWLQNFAHRATLAPWIFGVSTALSFVVAALTVSAQSLRAALSDPAVSLRYE
jgi:putative ABC transport system permease protein